MPKGLNLELLAELKKGEKEAAFDLRALTEAEKHRHMPRNLNNFDSSELIELKQQLAGPINFYHLLIKGGVFATAFVDAYQKKGLEFDEAFKRATRGYTVSFIEKLVKITQKITKIKIKEQTIINEEKAKKKQEKMFLKRFVANDMPNKKDWGKLFDPSKPSKSLSNSRSIAKVNSRSKSLSRVNSRSKSKKVYANDDEILQIMTKKIGKTHKRLRKRSRSLPKVNVKKPVKKLVLITDCKDKPFLPNPGRGNKWVNGYWRKIKNSKAIF
jgi:hypothetical protein